MNLLSSALKLRGKGLSIFPVDNATKVPLVHWKKYKNELPTYGEIYTWFTKNGRSIGVATGPTSNIIVIDFDFYKYPTVKEWYETNKHRLPKTWSETTRAGGLHLIYRWDSLLDERQCHTAGKIHEGLDTRGYGSYAKIAPSEGYTWINSPFDCELAAIPLWLIELLPIRKKQGEFSPSPTNWMIDALKSIQPGQGPKGRTPTFIRVIGYLKAKDITADIVQFLLQPWAEKYDYHKLEALIEDQYQRYPLEQGHEGPLSIYEFLKDRKPVEWICENLIARKAIGFFAGLPHARKTWMAMDLAIECARGGGQWLKAFPVCGATVWYIDQERPKEETQRRLAAMLSAKNLGSKAIENTLFVDCETTYRIDLLDSLRSFKRTLKKRMPDLVIIDSFKTFHTKEENNSTDIQTILETVKFLRKEFGCTIIFMDHENKGAFHDIREEEEPDYGRMSGSIAKPAAAEVILTIRSRDSFSSDVYVTKNTGGSPLPPFCVGIKDVAPDKSKIEVSVIQ